jgi:hypothetical protein
MMHFHILDNGRPRIRRLEHLDAGMLPLDARLEVVATTKPSNQENSLNVWSISATISAKMWRARAYGNTIGGALDLDRLDLIIDQAEDVGDEGSKDGLQVVSARAISKAPTC